MAKQKVVKGSKRIRVFKEKIQDKLYEPLEAFSVLNENAKKHESVDIVFVLGIDGKKSDQVVKGVVEHLPAGLGKKVSVAIFTKSNDEVATETGADYVGFEDLFAKVKSEEINCDVYLATIDVMPELAKMGLGRILKGKMPNPKFGTVIETKDIAKAIKMQQAGQLTFRSNGSLVHCSIGRASFTSEDLLKNYKAVLEAIKQAKPTVIKPHSYMKRVFVSTTFAPSIRLDIAETAKIKLKG